MGTATCQPSSLHQNQSQRAVMMVLKWVIKQGGSPVHGDSTVLHHAIVSDLVSP